MSGKKPSKGRIHPLLAIQWAGEVGESHLSPVLAAIPAVPGLLLCSSLRHRHQAQDQPTRKPAFGRWHWRTLTWLLLMSSPSDENKGFMGESTPQSIALALGTPGLGWQQCPGPSPCAGRCAQASSCCKYGNLLYSNRGSKRKEDTT